MPNLTIRGVGDVTVGDDFLKLSPEEQSRTVEEIASTVRSKTAAGNIQKSYSSMSAGQLGMEALRNAPGSAVQLGKDFVQPILHPLDTLANLKNLGKGILEKTGVISGDDAVHYADAVGAWAAARYGGKEEILRTMATDPVGFAADLSVFLTGGATAIGGRAGTVAGAVGRAIDVPGHVASAAAGVARGAATMAGVGAKRMAVADVARALGRDEMSVGDLQRAGQDAAAAGRPGQTVADLGGENVRGLTERVAQTPGAGRTIVRPALSSRQAAQADRIATDLSELTGTKRSALEAVTETMDRRAAQGRPLYQQAMQFNAEADADVSAAWAKATATGHGESILNGKTLRRNLQSEFGVEDINQVPLMVRIDAWKKAADDAVGAATRAGEKNTARVISQTRDNVLDVVKRKNPAYQQALGAWAGPTKYLEAIEAGKEILSTSTSAEELLSNVSKLGASEQEAFRIGALSAINAKLRSDSAKLADATKYLRSPEVRNKVAAIMPTKGAAEAWNKRLDMEVSRSELSRQALGGSPTARRQMELSDAGELVGDLAMHAFAGAPPVSLMRRIVGVPLGKMRDSLRSRTDQQLGKILMGSPADIPRQMPLPSARGAGRAAFQAGRLDDVLNKQ